MILPHQTPLDRLLGDHLFHKHQARSWPGKHKNNPVRPESKRQKVRTDPKVF